MGQTELKYSAYSASGMNSNPTCLCQVEILHSQIQENENGFVVTVVWINEERCNSKDSGREH